MSKPTRFKIGDTIRTSGGRTPWRIEAIGNGQTWLHHGRQVYRCTSLTSGRHEEYRVTNTDLLPWTGPLPSEPPRPSLLRGHTLASEGAPHDSGGRRTASGWRTRGTGYGLCSCGALSELELHSAGQRKQWHRMHKDQIRKQQAA